MLPVNTPLISTIFIKLVPCIALLGFVSACNFGQPAPTVDENSIKLGTSVVARVNGTPVYFSDVELEAVEQGLLHPGYPIDHTKPEFAKVLEDLIDQRLLALEAERRGLHRLESSQRRINAARERILGNILVEFMVDQAINEENINQLYNEQRRVIQVGEEILLRHILVATESEANRIYQELVGGGDFASLAFEHSLDQASRAEGGDVGYVTRDVLDPVVAGNAFALKKGQISTPFKSDEGWHILRLEDRREEAVPSLDQMRPQIIRYLTFDEIKEVLRDLRDKADIVSYPTDAAEILAPAEARVRMDGEKIISGPKPTESETNNDASTP